jgi:transcriptional regulator with XRE-family HTH domain
MKVPSMSVDDIGRSLQLAREQADLSMEEAAARAGLETTDLEALESITTGRMRNRVETLRSLRVYAESLGLSGSDYVMAVVDLWPSLDSSPARPLDSGQVPVVSVSAAPEGGHSPAGDDRTGVTDFSISGVVSPLDPGTFHDTGPIPMIDTGEIPVVTQSPPTWLKVLVVATATLVAVGIIALTEHSQFSSWAKDLRTDSNHWFHNAEVAAGVATTQTKPGRASSHRAEPKVVIVQHAATDLVTVNVHSTNFTVKMVAFKNPSWIQVTNIEQRVPIYEQVLAGGSAYSFNVDKSFTVETGSASARAYLYQGGKFIGYYFPTKAPFTITFNAVG